MFIINLLNFLVFFLNKKLTKKLDELQKRKFSWLVDKIILVLILSVGFSCQSYSNSKNNEIHCPVIDFEIIRFFPRTPVSPNVFLNQEKEKWVMFYKDAFSNIKTEILEKKKLIPQNQCQEIYFQKWQEKWKLHEKTLRLYYDTLQEELKLFLDERNLYEKEKILEDFEENKKALYESVYSYQKAIWSFWIDKNSQYEKHTKDIQIWFEVYSILKYELFYWLPDEFKREWFKKLSQLPN
ncbi:MAG: hypothetical protein NZ853_03775 [Leptospiraceae bacterium]|nr:hypothetical protein [Leptospiraceae bacterium]MDW7975294.1 hypothetical protein [Leptospiraceae bacterium]